MSAPLRIAVARPADWPAVARWTFRRSAAVRADRLVGLLASGEVDTGGVLVATRDGRPVGGLATQLLPGGTAVLLLPGGEAEEVRDALVAAAVAGFPRDGVAVAQAFIDPDELPRAAVLTRHGFRRVTTVSQMSLDPVAVPLLPAAAPPVHLVPYAVADAATFATTLLATYEDSLDVPEANVGRSAAEIVAGYRHGQPDPPEWWLAHDASGTPVGVLMLAATGTAVTDVSYLGVVPTARRRGIGRALLAFATEHALSARHSLELSVDDRNRPALQLYAAHGFRIRTSQHVFLWTADGAHG